MVGCAKHGHDELVKYAYLVPIYWLAMSAAAWVAFYELIVSPHHWAKTKHGLHLSNKRSVIHAEIKVGSALVHNRMKPISADEIVFDIPKFIN